MACVQLEHVLAGRRAEPHHRAAQRPVRLEVGLTKAPDGYLEQAPIQVAAALGRIAEAGPSPGDVGERAAQRAALDRGLQQAVERRGLGLERAEREHRHELVTAAAALRDAEVKLAGTAQQREHGGARPAEHRLERGDEHGAALDIQYCAAAGAEVAQRAPGEGEAGAGAVADARLGPHEGERDLGLAERVPHQAFLEARRERGARAHQGASAAARRDGARAVHPVRRRRDHPLQLGAQDLSVSRRLAQRDEVARQRGAHEEQPAGARDDAIAIGPQALDEHTAARTAHGKRWAGRPRW